jgi:hypothetical protein
MTLCKDFILVALFVLLVSITCLSGHALRAEQRQIIRSSDMIELIGVNIHMTYNDGAYATPGNVLKDLKFLGINHVRDGLPGTDSAPALAGRDALRRMIYDNIRLNVLIPSGWTSTMIAWLRSLEASVPGAIASIEGYNEINNFPPQFEGLSGAAAAKAGQKALYGTIKSDPVLSHVPVIDMTGFEMIKDPTFSYGHTLAGYADVLNVHVYPQNGAQPSIWINPVRPEIYRSVQDELPKAITEFGYASRPESNWGFIGVDERTQAKGVLNGLLDAARSGYDRVYLYELLDEKPDPQMKELEFHFGLFTFENEPKPAAQAIRNLTTILAGKNGAGAGLRGPLPSDPLIKVRVDEPDGNSPLLSIVILRDDGSPIVAVWRETPFWDRATGRPLEGPSIQATISFEKPCTSIRNYDLLQSSDPISVGSGGSRVMKVNDHVQLVECAF